MGCDESFRFQAAGRRAQGAGRRVQMTQHRTPLTFYTICFLIFALLLAGCASDAGSVRKDQGGVPAVFVPRMITDISTSEDAEAVHVLVKGNQPLTYTSVKQPFPVAVILYFSETSLEGGSKKTTIQESGIIDSVQASEMNGDGHTSRVEILLKKDVPYNVSRDEGSGIKISFAKTGSAFLSERSDLPPSPLISSLSPQPSPGARGEKPELEIWDPKTRKWVTESELNRPGTAVSRPPSSKLMPNATRLESVYATRLKDSLKVFVGANGMIKNYKSFTIGNPARIVFDIFNVKSPYKEEKRVPINSEWVKQVRYYGYPDRLRLVLDTQKAYLSKFSAYPVEDGLEIYVGAHSEKLMADSQAMRADIRQPTATRLQSVYATQMENSTIINVKGDGPIKNYKASVTEEPPSIVFDLFDIEGSYEDGYAFPVDSRWVKKVRYHAFPDKLRLLIDTQKDYLSSFSAYPDKEGLVIQVGQRKEDGSISPPSPVPSEPPAWVDLIVFVPEEAGKSSLIIETSRVVTHEIAETADKKLRLKLLNTKIPEYRYKQGPVMTSRFDAAVDQVAPVRQPGDENTAVFEIDLREAVPYFVEQTTDESGKPLLMVHFEASSLPPSSPSESLASSQVPAASVSVSGAGDTPPPPVPEGFYTQSPPFPEGETKEDAKSDGPEEDAEIESGAGETGSPDFDLPDITEKYTGERIALDFFKTDIKNVFRILREVSGKNFAIDSDVKGEVTLTLEHPVPWDQVLDLILKMNSLGKTFEGDIIRIATLSTLQKEEKQRQEMEKEEQLSKEQQKALAPIVTEYIPVNYSDAGAEIKPHLEAIKTKDRGSVSVDKRTNMIIMSDTEEKIKQAREIVEKLDKVTPQVIIEARIVEANVNFAKEIGTEWGLDGGIQGDAANAGVGPQRSYDLLGGTYGYNMAVNAPPGGHLGSIGFNFTRIAGTPFLLDAKLMAMESREDVKIITAPRVLTLDNKAATISQGFEYPYQTTDENGKTTTNFKQVNLNLDVTPHITPDNRISMKIAIDKNDVYVQTSEGPALTTKSAKTELLVNDGDTIVIGGIIRTTDTTKVSGVPGLSKIPLIGWLFKSKTDTEDRQELLIFITPRIVQLEQRRMEY
jgi:type IV pilus assembly protein PilQ